jgi:hypothetical protein
MMNTKVVAGGLAVALLGGGLAAGLAGAGSGGGSSHSESGTSEDNSGQDVSMTCATGSCDLVFIPPTSETVHPLGLDLQLVRADATQAVFTVAGQALTVTPDRPTTAQGATFTLTGPPNPLVKLHISKN